MARSYRTRKSGSARAKRIKEARKTLRRHSRRRVKRGLFNVRRNTGRTLTIPMRVAPRRLINDELNIFPATKLVTLYWCNTIKFSAQTEPVTAKKSATFGVNGLWDPILASDPTNTGEHRVRLVDKYMEFYNRYEVIASRIAVTQKVGSASGDSQHQADIAMGVGLKKSYDDATQDIVQVSGLTWHNALVERGVKMKTAFSMKDPGATFSQRPVRLSASWSKAASMKRYKRLKEDVDDLDPRNWCASSAGSSPTMPAASGENYDLFVTPALDNHATPEIELEIRMSFRVKFSDVKQGMLAVPK